MGHGPKHAADELGRVAALIRTQDIRSDRYGTGFIALAAVWQRRQGGTLYSTLPNIVSARSRLMPQIAKMDAYRARATDVAEIWSRVEGADTLPNPPQVNLFHLRLRGEREALLNQRDHVAETQGVWLFGGLRAAEGGWKTELTMGDAALELDLDRLEGAITRFFEFGHGGHS